jgi:hypothetical protein
MSNHKLIRVIATLIIVAGVGGYNYVTKDKSYSTENNNPAAKRSTTKSPQIDNQAQVLSKIRKEKNNTHARFWLESKAKVIKLLKDDVRGNPHQKFLVKLAPDITLLVAHNTALAKRVPIQKGDDIKIRARYEWNNRGGVLHWTHHDPKGKREGGWIYANGKYYK